MVEVSRKNAAFMKPLFCDTESAFVLSFLQGYMGRGWVDEVQNPQCGQIIVGDCILLAGDCQAEGAADLVCNIPPLSKMLLMIPQNEGWARLIKHYYPCNSQRILRYATKAKDGFHTKKLHGFVEQLESKYQLRSIDEQIYHETLKHEFSRDWCSQYATAEEYARNGLGFCITLDGEIVCGASSYISYEKGISIQIDTHDAYKRQGLATTCAARLILECIRRGIYPDWDAFNEVSLALAEKLGYHLYTAYTTYLVSC